MTLWTIGDIARHYGLDPNSVRYWTTREGFPAAVEARGRAGAALYPADEVKAWRRAHAAAPGRRRRAIVAAYEKHGSVAGAARATGVDNKTARKHLRAEGVIE
jgi:transposase-like protein